MRYVFIKEQATPGRLSVYLARLRHDIPMGTNCEAVMSSITAADPRLEWVRKAGECNKRCDTLPHKPAVCDCDAMTQARLMLREADRVWK